MGVFRTDLMQASLFPDNEEWKTVLGFISYEVSNLGRFRKKWNCEICHGTISNNGYRHIGLCRDGKQITKLAHRLIAETWLIKPSSQHNDVNHRNKKRDDNRVSNLEWMTRSQNSIHAKQVVREEGECFK